MSARRRKQQRGFALVIVAVCGVAMTAMALAVVFTAGSQRILSIKGAAIDHSTTIADSGMERALAYLQTVAQNELDFDAVLDPTLPGSTARDCIATGSARAVGRPRYSDATVETDADGTQYAKVAFNQGAYFTRFDDDTDDVMDPSADLSAFTGNHPNGGNCLEGQAFVPGNNPHRDRNRAVWVTVIGVYPDQPLAGAKHRIALRRYYVSPEATPVPAFFIDGDVTMTSSSTLSYCAAEGTVGITGDLNISGSATFAHCSTAAVGGTVTGTASNPSCTGSPWAPRGALSASAAVPTPPAPSPLHAGWTEPGRCVFRIAPNGVYFWDANGTRGLGACNAFNPLTTPLPTSFDPTPITIGAAAGKTCWLPLVLHDGSGAVTAGVSADELCATGWCPKANDNTAEIGFVGASVSPTFTAAGGNPWNAIGFATALPKPDFKDCLGHGPEFRPGQPFSTCSPDCDGTRMVVDFSSGVPRFTNNYAAYPPGVYLVAPGTIETTMTTVPATENASDWPQITVVALGNVGINSSTLAVFGVGTTPLDARNPTSGALRYPSLLVAGDLTLDSSSQMFLAGSLYVSGAITLNSSATLEVHGQVAAGDLAMNSSSTFRVIHDDDFGDPIQEPIIAQPTMSKTLR